MVLSAFSHPMSLDQDTSIKSNHSVSHNITVGDDQHSVSVTVKGKDIVSEQRGNICEVVCDSGISAKSEIGNGTLNISSGKNNSNASSKKRTVELPKLLLCNIQSFANKNKKRIKHLKLIGY